MSSAGRWLMVWVSLTKGIPRWTRWMRFHVKAGRQACRGALSGSPCHVSGLNSHWNYPGCTPFFLCGFVVEYHFHPWLFAFRTEGSPDQMFGTVGSCYASAEPDGSTKANLVYPWFENYQLKFKRSVLLSLQRCDETMLAIVAELLLSFVHFFRGQSSACRRSCQTALFTARVSVSGASNTPASTPSFMKLPLSRNPKPESTCERQVSGSTSVCNKYRLPTEPSVLNQRFQVICVYLHQQPSKTQR